MAAKRALRRPNLWDDEDFDDPALTPSAQGLTPFPLREVLTDTAIAIGLVALALALFYILPIFLEPK